MLQVTIPASELLDEATSSFIVVKETTLNLEHSLVSISKWESKWRKPFLSRDPKTEEETIDYIRCMTTNSNVDPNVYKGIPNSVNKQINDYIENPMTATTFNDRDNRHSREIITSELIYCWMVNLGIPFECQKWHLNRLLTLIKVCNVKNTPPKMMRGKELMNSNQSINAARRARMHSRG